jgi:hypothetical protein
MMDASACHSLARSNDAQWNCVLASIVVHSGRIVEESEVDLAERHCLNGMAETFKAAVCTEAPYRLPPTSPTVRKDHDRHAHNTPHVRFGAAELQIQLDHPSAEIIRSRATEVFSNTDKAQTWLHRRREIFNGRYPEQIIESGDVERMRDVLKALIAIEFGTFS